MFSVEMFYNVLESGPVLEKQKPRNNKHLGGLYVECME